MSGAGRISEPFAHLQPTDALIEAYRRSGRPEDFQRVVQRFAGLVLSECRRTAGNLHDAEDASQMAFLALAMEIKAGTEIRRVGPWLQRVSRRQALKIVRSRGRRKRREDAVRRSELLPHEPDAPLDAAIEGGIVRDHIDQLPERYRVPIVLHYFGGLSLNLIANELKLTPAAVGTRLHRGRKMLGGRLSKTGLAIHNGTFEVAMVAAVPAAVIAAIVRGATNGSAVHLANGGLAAATTTAALTASLTTNVIEMLRAAATVATRRPLIAAMLAVFAAGGGTGLAWRSLPQWIREPKLDAIDLGGWIRSLMRRAAAPSASAPAQRPLARVAPLDFDPTPFSFEPVTFAAGPPLAGSRMQHGSVALDLPMDSSHETTDAAFGHPLETSVPIAVPRTGPSAPAWTPAPNFTFAVQRPAAAAPAQTLIELGELAARTSSTLPPGQYHATRIDVGADGRAPQLSITPQTRLYVDDFHIAAAPRSAGRVVHDGGYVNARRLTIGGGEDSRGTYEILNSGRLDVGALSLGARPSSVGELFVNDGDVRLTGNPPDRGIDGTPPPAAAVTVGDRGVGRLVIGTADAPGRVTAASADVSAPAVIRATPGARGLVRGWGTFGTNGPLTNNGLVVADGHDHNRPLDLSGFADVGNTIENPSDGGTNGWHALRGGRLTLPTIRITPAPEPQTYTWGESEDDPTIDLVNSLRFTVSNQPEPSDVNISLRTVAADDPLDVDLPDGVSVIALYEVRAGEQFDPEAVDLVVRYNDQLANAYYPGEAAVRLLAYDDGEAWEAVADAWLDAQNNLVGGSVGGGFDLLAVAVPLNWDAWRPTTATAAAAAVGLREASLTAPDAPVESAVSSVWLPGAPANVPEPSAIFAVAAGVTLIGGRRVRR